MLIYFNHAAVSVICFFLTVPWVGLQCVLVTVPGHTHLLFDKTFTMKPITILTSDAILWMVLLFIKIT